MIYRVTIEVKAVTECAAEEAVNIHGKSDFEIGKVLGGVEEHVREVLLRELEEGATVEVSCKLEKIE